MKAELTYANIYCIWDFSDEIYEFNQILSHFRLIIRQIHVYISMTTTIEKLNKVQ